MQIGYARVSTDDPDTAVWRRQRVGEDESTLLGQPKRCLTTAPSVAEGNETSWQLAAGLDPSRT